VIEDGLAEGADSDIDGGVEGRAAEETADEEDLVNSIRALDIAYFTKVSNFIY